MEKVPGTACLFPAQRQGNRNGDPYAYAAGNVLHEHSDHDPDGDAEADIEGGRLQRLLAPFPEKGS